MVGRDRGWKRTLMRESMIADVPLEAVGVWFVSQHRL